uniref:Putative secreted protein n=1 Tax=Ixodes ricinus TaxID=34613 RepID=A0A6B0U8M8_IXORI
MAAHGVPLWCTRISLWPCWLLAASCYRSRCGCPADTERLSKLTRPKPMRSDPQIITRSPYNGLAFGSP